MVLTLSLSKAAASGTVRSSLSISISGSQCLGPGFYGRKRYSPPAPRFASDELSRPDQSVQIIETYSQPSCRLNCGNLDDLFLCHRTSLTPHHSNAYTC